MKKYFQKSKTSALAHHTYRKWLVDFTSVIPFGFLCVTYLHLLNAFDLQYFHVILITVKLQKWKTTIMMKFYGKAMIIKEHRIERKGKGMNTHSFDAINKHSYPSTLALEI